MGISLAHLSRLVLASPRKQENAFREHGKQGQPWRATGFPRLFRG